MFEKVLEFIVDILIVGQMHWRQLSALNYLQSLNIKQTINSDLEQKNKPVLDLDGSDF
jgi:hypothetical protein